MESSRCKGFDNIWGKVTDSGVVIQTKTNEDLSLS